MLKFEFGKSILPLVAAGALGGIQLSACAEVPEPEPATMHELDCTNQKGTVAFSLDPDGLDTQVHEVIVLAADGEHNVVVRLFNTANDSSLFYNDGDPGSIQPSDFSTDINATTYYPLLAGQAEIGAFKDPETGTTVIINCATEDSSA